MSSAVRYSISPRLFGAEGLDGVEAGGATRGQVAGQERSGYQAESNYLRCNGKREWNAIRKTEARKEWR
jgi:hypothetical protein